MKYSFCSFSMMSAMAACFLLLFTCACDKGKDDNNNQGKMWNPDWLIGTWEGTTPSGVTPFENTKIRIVFGSYNLEIHDTVPGGERKAYGYSGTFTWNPDQPVSWSVNFTHENYPDPGYNIILWDCVNAIGGYTMNNVSLRTGDDQQTDPWHSFDLDWGAYTDNSGNPPLYIDFYGDIEIETGGNLERAEYPPDQGTMIRMTKK
jgi:hypothetical protein